MCVHVGRKVFVEATRRAQLLNLSPAILRSEAKEKEGISKKSPKGRRVGETRAHKGSAPLSTQVQPNVPGCGVTDEAAERHQHLLL